MQKEQAGEYEAALEIYADLLKKNPANLMVMKRKVSHSFLISWKYVAVWYLLQYIATRSAYIYGYACPVKKFNPPFNAFGSDMHI